MVALLAIATPALAQDAKAPPADNLSAQQIVDKMLARDDAFGVSSGQAQLSLLIEGRDGARKQRKLEVKSRRGDGGARTIVQLTAPATVQGQAFLFIENKNKEDDVWMYLPAFKVSRRVEGSNKKGAFLGSHFTFADLESRDIKAATYERLPDETVVKDDVFVIASTPKDAASADYGKVVSYIRKSDYVPLKIRFYAKDAKTEVKTLFVDLIAKNSAGEPYIKKSTLSAGAGGFTTMSIDAIDDQAKLPESLFTREQLGR